MTPSVPVGEVRLLGDRAFLIGVADAAAARALAGKLTETLSEPAGSLPVAEGGAEVVCGAATVMVHVTDDDAELAAAPGARRHRAPWFRRGLPRRGSRSSPRRVVTIACRFDGPDLEEVAALAGSGRTRWCGF